MFQVSFACPELHGPRHWARLPRRVRERGNPARLIRRWRRFAGFEAAARFAARSGLEIALPRRWKFSGLRQSHQLIFEDALVHKLQVLSDLRHELHLIQHLGLEVDARRAAYYNYYSSGTWGMAETYDLCIDSSVLGIDGTTGFVLEFVERKLGVKP